MTEFGEKIKQYTKVYFCQEKNTCLSHCLRSKPKDRTPNFFYSWCHRSLRGDRAEAGTEPAGGIPNQWWWQWRGFKRPVLIPSPAAQRAKWLGQVSPSLWVSSSACLIYLDCKLLGTGSLFSQGIYRMPSHSGSAVKEITGLGALIQGKSEHKSGRPSLLWNQTQRSEHAVTWLQLLHWCWERIKNEKATYREACDRQHECQNARKTRQPLRTYVWPVRHRSGSACQK